MGKVQETTLRVLFRSLKPNRTKTYDKYVFIQLRIMAPHKYDRHSQAQNFGGFPLTAPTPII
jgi:hypothetical protein